MEKRDKKIPYEVVIQERKRVDLYGNIVYYIHWFDKYGYNMCRETKKKLLQAIKGVNVEEEDVSLYTTGGWD